MVKVKAHELRKKDQEQLKKQVEELKTELSTLRVAKVAGGAPAKLAKIKSVRRSIASVLTVIHEKKLSEVKANAKGKKYQPLDVRGKRTRAIRRRLTKKQENKLALRVMKKKLNFQQRRYAVAN
jgi:large subunit ribosomal protein L35e